MRKSENIAARRALKAFQWAQEASTKSGNYAAAVQELPALLRRNGLRLTLAFYYTKKDAHRVIFGQIKDWFAAEEEPTGFMRAKLAATGRNTPENFMSAVLELNDDEYRIVQDETIQLANWMMRFVKTEETQPL